MLSSLRFASGKDGASQMNIFATGAGRMPESYVFWLLLPMVGYPSPRCSRKLAGRSSDVTSYMVLAGLHHHGADLFARHGCHPRRAQAADLRPEKGNSRWLYCRTYRAHRGGVFLFRGRRLGPANVVVPIYGRSICFGGSLLGVMFSGRAHDLEQDRGARRRRVGRGSDFFDVAAVGDLPAASGHALERCP